MSETTYKFCPICTAPLVEKHIYDAQRLTCPQCDFILFLEPKLVTVVVVQRQDTFLLGKRNMEPGRGMWSFSGGYVDRGENVEDAAMREVKEETNLDVRLQRLLGIYSEKGQPQVVIAYLGSVIDDNVTGLTPQPEEVSELGFFTLDAFPPLAFPMDRRIMHDLRCGA